MIQALANKDIRAFLKDNQIPFWRVADALGICENTFTRWMRHEMDPNRKKFVLSGIDTLMEDCNK